MGLTACRPRPDVAREDGRLHVPGVSIYEYKNIGNADADSRDKCLEVNLDRLRLMMSENQ